MTETYYRDPLKYGDAKSTVEWTPIIDGVLYTPPDITKEFMNLIKRTPEEESAERLYQAVTNLLEIGKRDLSNPKYDGYFRELSIIIMDINDRKL